MTASTPTTMTNSGLQMTVTRFSLFPMGRKPTEPRPNPMIHLLRVQGVTVVVLAAPCRSMIYDAFWVLRSLYSLSPAVYLSAQGTITCTSVAVVQPESVLSIVPGT